MGFGENGKYLEIKLMYSLELHNDLCLKYLTYQYFQLRHFICCNKENIFLPFILKIILSLRTEIKGLSSTLYGILL